MRSIYGIWRILARRSLANWRLVALFALGVLIASSLLAAAPVYARALADLGVTFALRDRLATAPVTEIQVRDLAVGAEDGRRYQTAIEQRINERLGWFTGTRERYIVGPELAVVQDESQRVEQHKIAGMFTLSSAAAHLRVVEGRLPGPATGAPGVIEFAISPESARASGLKPGDRFPLIERFDDCAREIPKPDGPPPPVCNPTVGISGRLEGTLTGIIEPADPDAGYWVRTPSQIFAPWSQGLETGTVLPALVDEATLFSVAAALSPEYRGAFNWYAFANPEKLNRANYERARADIAALREDVRPLGGFAFSPMEGVLADFNTELSYQQKPLLILLLQIAGIALFYVGIVAALVVERQAEEIALLRSRGAGMLQIGGVYFLEGIVIAAPVVLLAPLIAGAATALLGRTDTFERVTGGRPLPVTLGPETFLLAALGALLSVLVLLGMALITARTNGVTARRQAARPANPFYLRYYLDVAVIALAGLLLWEMNERGSVFTPSTTGGLSSDPLLLASPALLTLGAAAAVLRLYPLALRVASAVAGRFAGVPVALGLRTVVRNPGPSTRLALLLMMAVAVGAFAASYSSTAERSFRDRARYEAGVDLRAAIVDASGSTDQELLATLTGFPGVERTGAALRLPASLATSGSSTREIQLLGVDPGATSDLLWFREDLADQPLPALMTRLRAPAPFGRELPGDPKALTIWVDPGEPRDATMLYARVRDANGTAAFVELGRLDFTGWRQLRGALTGQYFPILVAPVSLVSLIVSQPPNMQLLRTAPIGFDDIAVESADGVSTAVEGFEGTVTWGVAPQTRPLRGETITDEFAVSPDQPHSGAGAGRFTLRPGVTGGARGIYSRELTVPVPAIVNPEFTAITGAGVGAQALILVRDTIVPIIVRGHTRLFPTTGAGGPVVLVDRQVVTAWLAAFGDSQPPQANEAWFRLRPGTDPERLETALRASPYRFGELINVDRALTSVNENPLIAAGGSGILFVAFLGIVILIAAALAVSIVTAVRRRRTELAVLRVMGLSRGQMFRLMVFEYALVAVLGVGVGIVLGRAIGRRMLSFLEVTDRGTPVVPPFVLQTDWPVVGIAVAVIGVTVVAGIVAGTRWVLRQSAAGALRTE